MKRRKKKRFDKWIHRLEMLLIDTKNFPPSTRLLRTAWRSWFYRLDYSPEETADHQIAYGSAEWKRHWDDDQTPYGFDFKNEETQ